MKSSSKHNTADAGKLRTSRSTTKSSSSSVNSFVFRIIEFEFRYRTNGIGLREQVSLDLTSSDRRSLSSVPINSRFFFGGKVSGETAIE
ncbi:hypothetical protein HanRHA438_Chr11g0513891 [Helianthus annuus]|nr:hypothetical protein HanRHA438_Chr11g0513891 [Helianthus annuus]